jgi:hypothetical protein
MAIVKTRDITKNAAPLLQTPLSLRDAASAGSDHPELAVIAIPPARGAGRRINAGIVNVGTIPATFRISATNRAGRRVGREVEMGIPEEGVWFLHDLEVQLGVVIDESMIVRMTAIAGTGLGFVTVVELDGTSDLIPAVPAQQR